MVRSPRGVCAYKFLYIQAYHVQRAGLSLYGPNTPIFQSVQSSHHELSLIFQCVGNYSQFNYNQPLAVALLVHASLYVKESCFEFAPAIKHYLVRIFCSKLAVFFVETFWRAQKHHIKHDIKRCKNIPNRGSSERSHMNTEVSPIPSLLNFIDTSVIRLCVQMVQ